MALSVGVGRVWPGQLAAALGAHTATVDDDIPGSRRRFRSRAHDPDAHGVPPVQPGLCAPFAEAAAQCRAADPIPGGPQFPPLHAFAETPAMFRPPPGLGSVGDHDRCTALQSSRSDRPPSRMPLVPSRPSHAYRTEKLGPGAILSSRCNARKLAICPWQTSENRALGSIRSRSRLSGCLCRRAVAQAGRPTDRRSGNRGSLARVRRVARRRGAGTARHCQREAGKWPNPKVRNSTSPGCSP